MVLESETHSNLKKEPTGYFVANSIAITFVASPIESRPRHHERILPNMYHPIQDVHVMHKLFVAVIIVQMHTQTALEVCPVSFSLLYCVIVFCYCCCCCCLFSFVSHLSCLCYCA